MAIPTTEEIKQNTAAIEENNAAQEKNNILGSAAANITNAMSGMLTISNGILGVFQTKCAQAGVDLNNFTKSSLTAKIAIAGLGAAFLNTFDNAARFGNMSGELQNITTWESQIKSFTSMINTQGLGSRVVQDALSKMGASFVSAGGKAEDWNKTIKQGPNAIVSLVNGFFKLSSSGAQMEEYLYRTAAATGELGKLSEKAGSNLEYMNSIMLDTNRMSTTAQQATGENVDIVHRWMDALRRIPDGLNGVVNTGGSANLTMDKLTAAIKLAHGVGRSQVDITTDLASAYRKFNITGEDSLRFVHRYSALSKQLGVDFGDMKGAFDSAINQFENISDAGDSASRMTKSVADIMMEYHGALTKVGMTGKHAADTIASMTAGMKGLRVEQKAFLSAQAGGPGGLMGAAQIEMMLRKGQTKEVMDMAMKTLESRTGRAVTLEEATQSQAAAAQREMQIRMLTEGPLGKMFGTAEDAGKFLEARRAMQEGRAAPKEMEDMSKAIQAGTMREQRTRTPLTDILPQMSQLVGINEAMNTNLNQIMFSSGKSAQHLEALSAAQKAAKEGGTARMASAAARSGEFAKTRAAEAMKAGPVPERSQMYISGALPELIDALKTLPGQIRSAFEGLASPIKEATIKRSVVLATANAEKTEFPEAAKTAETVKGATPLALGGNTPLGRMYAAPETKETPTVAVGQVTQNSPAGQLVVDVNVKLNPNNPHATAAAPSANK